MSDTHVFFIFEFSIFFLFRFVLAKIHLITYENAVMMAATINAAAKPTKIITKTQLCIITTLKPSLACIVVITQPAATVVEVVVIRASVASEGPRKLVELLVVFGIVKPLLGLGRAVVINAAVVAVLVFVDVLFVVWGGVVVAEEVLVLSVEAVLVLGLVVTAVVVKVLLVVSAVVVVAVVVVVVVKSVFHT